VDALRRIETMALLAGVGLPVEAIRAQVVSAVDLVVQVARLPGGHRAVVEVAEVAATVPSGELASVTTLATAVGVVVAPTRPSRAVPC
jgi:Flp pilus assembly CpaF family ATPase